MSLRSRSLFSRRDLPVFALALLALALALIPRFTAAPGRTAVLLVDGQTVATRDLSRLTGPETLTVAGENGITATVEFSPGGARVSASTCPDKTCVRAGLLTRAGETAVCLPGRIVLRIDGPGDLDAETY